MEGDSHSRKDMPLIGPIDSDKFEVDEKLVLTFASEVSSASPYPTVEKSREESFICKHTAL